MLVLGLDIGGANLKAATNDAHAAARPFALWKHPQRLENELRTLIAQLPAAGAVAVTMTGELADCYASKAEGVRAIVAAASAAAGDRPTLFWQTGGEFLEREDAAALPRLVAASNWHALATFCGRLVPTGPALLIDVGSTTTDLIPLESGRVAAQGLTDLERLRAGELVYTGAMRTPVCAVARSVRLGGEEFPLAAELFATTRDVYLVLGELAEDAEDTDTADGRPATIPFAQARLARMLCADPEELGEEGIAELAQALADEQQRQIRAAMERAIARSGVPRLLVSGSGSFVAERVISRTESLRGAEIVNLAELFAKKVSGAACAFAVARLAAERLGSRMED